MTATTMRPARSRTNLFSTVLYAAESLSALLFSLVSVALIARHFGPEQVARYNVAQSVSTILIVVATLGLDQFIIREMARNPHDREYATSAQTGLLFGWLGYVLLLLGYYALVGDLQRDLVLLLCIVASTLFLRVLFIKLYLQAQHDPQPIAVGAVLSRLAAVVYLLAGAWADLAFDAMMLYLPLQAILMFLVMLAMRPEWLGLMRPQHFQARRLMASLREARPIVIASALYFFYSQSDILMMSHLLDDTVVGVYSVAIRLVPLAAFIGFSLLATFYKEMERRLAEEPDHFDAYVRSVLALHFGAGLALAIGVTLCADAVIHVLYGARFAQSAEVLKIACWAWVFMMPAALFTRLLIMLGFARYELLKMLLVAPLVVGLNYLAITQIGILGAAAMCVLAYLIVDFLVYALFKDTRRLARLGAGALSDIVFHPARTARACLALLRARH